MTIIQSGLFGNIAVFCERCGRPLSNPLSIRAHQGPICRGRTGAKDMPKEKKIDMREWGTRFNYKGFGGCDCHCYIKVNHHVVICTEAPDNEGTSITNLAEAVAQAVSVAYNIPFNRLIWIEHYPHNSFSSISETFDRVEFDISRESRNGLYLNSPKWTPLDRDQAFKMLEEA